MDSEVYNPSQQLVQYIGQNTTMFTIPVELAQRILSFCHPWDVAAFSRSCRIAYGLVYLIGDQYLWRQLFLAYPFDNPTQIAKARSEAGLPFIGAYADIFDWKEMLTKRLNAELVVHTNHASETENQHALATFISVIKQTAPPSESPETITDYSPSSSSDLQWLGRVFRESRILEEQRWHNPSAEIAQQLGQLRALFTMYLDSGKFRATTSRLQPKRNKSRSFVYDLRNYHSGNGWGPYLIDGSVNWIHVETLINVILMNLRELPVTWAIIKPPLELEATRPHSAPGEFTAHDWAGVEGTWRRYVCFMDYRDLFAFNYSDLADGPRHPKFFEDPRFREATRLIEIKLQIVPAQQIRFYRCKKEETTNKYPPLYFTGSSRGVSGNEAVVEGFVRMGKDGNVCWQFMSVYDNSPQWSSNGVQLGDIGSAMGVIGVWTTALHEQGDPVGPFWMWKAANDSPSSPMDYID